MYATKKISQSAVPLIHQVIPLIDSITSHFDAVLDSSTTSLAIQHAALRGLLLLNKYYACTDDMIVYRISMSTFHKVIFFLSSHLCYLVLHPRIKTQYFKKAGWEEEWIENAKFIAKNEWVTNYKPSTSASTLDTPLESRTSSDSSDVCLEPLLTRISLNNKSSSDPLCTCAPLLC